MANHPAAQHLSKKSRAQDPRSPVQRDRILAAAIELMAEGGEQSVTMAAVARRADSARGTVYYHFGDRDALLAAMRGNLQAQLLRLAHGPHHFRNPYGLALRLAVEDQSIIRSRIHHILEQGPLQDDRTRNLLDRLAQMDAEHALRDGVDPVAAALICAALDFAGLMAIAMGGDPDERRTLTRRVSETWHQMFIHGALKTPPDEPPS